jgi:hypothetical protein
VILEKLKALLGAENTLQAREKIIDALRAEEKRLSKLILERVAAERALVEGETAVTLGEQADANAVRRKVDGAIAAINRQASKVAGLRSRLAGQAPELEAQRVALKSAMPSHMEAVKRKLSEEWAAGIAAFGALLAKRGAIESLVGKLPLADPRPVPYELPTDIAGPWRTIESIVEALDEIAGWNRAAMMPAVDAMGNGAHHSFDASAVYVITHPAAGAEVGTLVMEPSFSPGTLNHMAQIGYAVPLAAIDWQNATEAGRMAAQRASAERERERQQADVARDAPHLIQYDPAAAAAGAAEQQRPTNGPVTPVSSGPPPKPWGNGTQRQIIGGL